MTTAPLLNKYSNSLFQEYEEILSHSFKTPFETSLELINLNSKLFEENLNLKLKQTKVKHDLLVFDAQTTTAIASNKNLTNETSRRAAKEELKISSTQYQELQSTLEDVQLKLDTIYFLQQQVKSCLGVLKEFNEAE